MARYRVYYKGYYREYSEGKHADVDASDEVSALRKFFKERRSELREADLLEEAQLPSLGSLDIHGEYIWWEGDWLEEYRGIEEIDLTPCPLCDGTGEVASAVARQSTREPS
jgi:hypothetical protein